MKLKFERFEGLTSFTVRGTVLPAEVKLLQIGLETLVKQLESPIVINLSMAKIPEALAPVFQVIKKSLPPQTKHKIHWITPLKSVGDFPTLHAFTSRLTGFKHRQIGERLILEDQIHELNEEMAALEAKVSQTTGDDAKAHELILQNQTLKVQERILRQSIHFQKERMKLQAHVPSLVEDVRDKLKLAREEVKKAYEMDIDV